MSTTVPLEAARWIVECLQTECRLPCVHQDKALTTGSGIELLSVKQLKAVTACLERKLRSQLGQEKKEEEGNVSGALLRRFGLERPKPSAKKAQWTGSLSRCLRRLQQEGQWQALGLGGSTLNSVAQPPPPQPFGFGAHPSVAPPPPSSSSSFGMPQEAPLPQSPGPAQLPEDVSWMGQAPIPGQGQYSQPFPQAMGGCFQPFGAAMGRSATFPSNPYARPPPPPPNQPPPFPNGGFYAPPAVTWPECAAAGRKRLRSVEDVTPTARKIKVEKAEEVEDWERPRNQQEAAMLAQLRGMGFTDNGEILSGIRHVMANTPGDVATVVDMAMVWIVNQREEAEEARKEDLARMTSEQNREEEEERRRCNELRLHSAPLQDLLGSLDDNDDDEEEYKPSQFFPQSIVLQSAAVRGVLASMARSRRKSDGGSLSLSSTCSSPSEVVVQVVDDDDDEEEEDDNEDDAAVVGRMQVIRFLTLEKKSLLWYGTVEPWAYFRFSVTRRLSLGGKALSSSLLQEETERLERGLFSLAAQQEEGGVMGRLPKIFWEAKRQARREGLPEAPTTTTTAAAAAGDDDDDDDVVAVVSTRTNKKEEACSGGEVSKRRRCVEIVEVL